MIALETDSLQCLQDTKSATVKSKGTSSHDLTTITTPIRFPGTFCHCSSSDFLSILCTPALFLSKIVKGCHYGYQVPNITIWSMSSLFFIGPIFICSLGFYTKLHYCGLGCLVMYFFICILCHTIVKMNCCYCEMGFLSNGTTLGTFQYLLLLFGHCG